MIYRCPYEKCKLNEEITYKRSFINHIKYHFSVKELKFPLICSQDGCKESFCDFVQFNQHLNKFHNDNSTKNYDRNYVNNEDELNKSSESYKRIKLVNRNRNKQIYLVS
jgi:hypothetical protein